MAHLSQDDGMSFEGGRVEIPSPVVDDAAVESTLYHSNGDTRMKPRRNAWKSYQHFVKRHYRTLQHWDDTIMNLLYWAPLPSSNGKLPTSRWREILYGLLSLHRMAVDIAAHDEGFENPYGTTVKVESGDCSHAIVIRIVLTVMQCLLPTFLELSTSQGDSVTSEVHRSTIRLFVERTKFLLRMTLLVSYWRKIRRSRLGPGEEGGNVVVPGILRRGGIYVPEEECCSSSIRDECARQQRQQYVGRRTGRRVCDEEVPCGNAPHQLVRLMLGEVLSACRPLYWANAEVQHAKSVEHGSLHAHWLSWVIALGMELLSLRCLSMSGASESTCAETKRRRMKVMLCLLRTPAWESLSHPLARWLLTLISRIPIGGRMFETYMWEALSYCKHPYFLEES